MRQSAFEENFIEVAIIDDHALFRQSLKKALHYHGQIKVGIEASDYSELLDKLSISKVEIIIMDLCMPDLNRTKDTIRQIHQLLPLKKEKTYFPVSLLSTTGRFSWSPTVYGQGSLPMRKVQLSLIVSNL